MSTTNVKAPTLTQVWEQTGISDKPSRVELVRQLFFRAFSNFWASPITSVVTTVTVSCVLSVFAVLLFLRENVQHSLENSRDKIKITVFLKDDVTDTGREEFAESVKQLEGAVNVQSMSREQALEQFRSMLGPDERDIVEGLAGINPLPSSLTIYVESRSEEEISKRIQSHMSADPRTESVHVDRGFAEHVEGAIRIARFLGIGIALVFFVIGVAIIYNTIRLALFSHRAEIEIMELLGASPAVICSPFVLEGLLHGLIGSFVAATTLAGVYLIALQAHHRSDVAKLFIPELIFLTPSTFFALACVGVAIGILGSYVAVHRFLERG